MGRRRKDFRIAKRHGKIHISFNEAGWSQAHTRMLQFIVSNETSEVMAEAERALAGEVMADAVEKYARILSPDDPEFYIESGKLEAEKDKRRDSGELIPNTFITEPESYLAEFD